MQRHLYLDIETIPGQSSLARDMIADDAATEKAAVTAPANYKDPVKIAEYINARCAEIDADADAKWRRTSFDGALGQVVVIGAALDDSKPVTFVASGWSSPEYEAAILHSFVGWLTLELTRNDELSTVIVGHYVSEFDLRFLRHRSIINGIRLHRVIARACEAKPWETDKVYDTMVQWSGVKDRISLDKLCRALGIPGKGDMDGSKVWDAVQEGRIAEVAAYCADDVRKVRDVHRRMTFATV